MMACPATPAAYQLLHQGSLALAQAEANGIRVDVEYLKAAIDQTSLTIKNTEAELQKDEIWKTWKKHFSGKAKLSKPQQLAHVLFKVMKLPYPGGMTATGKMEVDEAVFDKVNLPFTKQYIRLNKLLHSRATYLYGIQRELVDDYLHPVFNLHFAVSYRSSSDSPNFQNMPIRDKIMGALIRQAFIASEGNLLGEIDFSGIEVRIAYCYHKDPTMRVYLTDPNSDMHRDEASSIFMLKPEQVCKRTTRDSAKNQWVFPNFYGDVYFQMAPQIWEAMAARDFRVGKENDGITIREHLASHGITELGDCNPRSKPRPGTYEAHLKTAQDAMWTKRWPIYAGWKRTWWRQYQQNGGFLTYTGFYCSWGKAGPMNRNAATNYPVQGAAFHCLLWCLVKLQEWLTKYKMRTRIVGQIHDSILLDIYPPEAQDVLTAARHLMTKAILKYWDWLIIPLDAEVEIAPMGKSWHHKEVWTDKDGEWKPKPKAA